MLLGGPLERGFLDRHPHHFLVELVKPSDRVVEDFLDLHLAIGHRDFHFGHLRSRLDLEAKDDLLAGAEVTTLNELVALTAQLAGVTPPALHWPVWPFWLAGAACEAVCAPLGIPPPIFRRRVDFFTKSRAFDISRARAELGFAPRIGLREGIGRTLEWYREHGWI